MLKKAFLQKTLKYVASRFNGTGTFIHTSNYNDYATENIL